MGCVLAPFPDEASMHFPRAIRRRLAFIAGAAALLSCSSRDAGSLYATGAASGREAMRADLCDAIRLWFALLRRRRGRRTKALRRCLAMSAGALLRRRRFVQPTGAVLLHRPRVRLVRELRLCRLSHAVHDG